jgi:threonyl-tRNA synthetase
MASHSTVVEASPRRRHIMSQITVTLPDGSTKQLESGAPVKAVAEAISPRLADAALAAFVGDKMVDLVDSGWRAPEGTINMFDYDLNEVMAQVSRHAGHPVVALPTSDDAHLGVHILFKRAR